MKLFAMNRPTGKVVAVLDDYQDGALHTLDHMAVLAEKWNHEETRLRMLIDYVTGGGNIIETPYNLPLGI